MDIKNANDWFNPMNYQISLGTHRQLDVIWLRFPYNENLIKALKNNTPAKWSTSQNAWYLPDNHHYRKLCNIGIGSVGKEVLAKISDVNMPEFLKFQNMLVLKGYSANTMRTYSIEFAQLLYLLKNLPVHNLTTEKLQSYFLYCHKELKLSESVIHSRINAIKFYFEQVLHQDKMFLDIPRPKKPLQLPKSLNTEEIKKLFEVTENIKHRLILQLCYGMGLRVSEVVNLKITDIDSKSMRVLIQRAKGKKDRYVNLPETILENLRFYYQKYHPKIYLFEGQYGGQFSPRSVQMVFKEAMKKAKINKQIGIHGLRHSYASHLLEMGTDICLIQKLLGHNDIKTTLIYTQVSERQISRVKSPLDHL